MSLRNQIIDALAARAAAEKFADSMAVQQKHHEANKKPLEDMQNATQESITATQAHKQAIANRDEANKRKEAKEDKTKEKIDDYATRAGKLTTLTVPLKGLAKFTGLANSLPDSPGVVQRFKRNVLKVNSDANRFLGQLDQMDQSMKDQKTQHVERDKGIQADADTLKSTDGKARESADAFDSAKQTTDDFDQKNDERIKTASEQKAAARRTGASFEAQAKEKESHAVSLAAAMQFWAHDHSEARKNALEQTRVRLQAMGYRVTEVRER